MDTLQISVRYTSGPGTYRAILELYPMDMLSSRTGIYKDRRYTSFLSLTVSWGQWEDFLLLRIRECSSVILSFMTSTEDSTFCITLLPVLCSATLSLHILPLSPGMSHSILLTYAEIETEPGLDMLGKMLYD